VSALIIHFDYPEGGMAPMASRQFESGGSRWRVSVDEGGATAFGSLDEVPGPRPCGLRFFDAATGESRFLACDVTEFRTQERLDSVPHERLGRLLRQAESVRQHAPRPRDRDRTPRAGE
jgi:hypothetical protein